MWHYIIWRSGDGWGDHLGPLYSHSAIGDGLSFLACQLQPPPPPITKVPTLSAIVNFLHDQCLIILREASLVIQQSQNLCHILKPSRLVIGLI